jgi:hypothetical protein
MMHDVGCIYVCMHVCMFLHDVCTYMCVLHIVRGVDVCGVHAVFVHVRARSVGMGLPSPLPEQVMILSARKPP